MEMDTLEKGTAQEEATMNEGEAQLAHDIGEIVGKKPKKKKERKKLSKKAKKRISIVVILIVIIATIFGMYKLVFEKKEKEVMTGMAFRGSMISEIKNRGNAIPKEAKDIITGAKGKVLNVYVKDGDVVEPGAPLFTIDSSAFTENLNKKRQALDDSMKSVNKIQESIANLTVKAPFTGKILEVSGKKGDMASGKIGTMIDDSYMKLTLYFSYAYIDQIQIGQNVTVSIPQSMAAVEGTVDTIEKIEKITPQGTVLFEVTVKMKNPGTLTKEMGAVATVHTDAGDVMPAESGVLKYNQEQEINAKTAGEIEKMLAKDYYKFNAGETICIIKDDTLHTSLVSAQESYNSVKKEYDKLNEERNEYEAFAPIGGTVLACTIKEGAELLGGTSVVAMQIANLNEMVIDIQIDELDIGKVSLGMEATISKEGDEEIKGGMMMSGMGGGMTISIDGGDGGDVVDMTGVEGEEMAGPMIGVLTNISLQGKNENGVSFFPAKITISNAKGIYTGMNVKYSIITSQKSDCLLIPTDGAVYTDIGQVAFVREGSVDKSLVVEVPNITIPKGFVPISITVGASDGVNIEVISGIEEGMEVALVGTAVKNDENGSIGYYG